MNIRTFSAMKKGPRSKQEDCLLVGTEVIQADEYEKEYQFDAQSLLVAACDGLGGHEAGDVASSFVCRQLRSRFQADSFQPKAISGMIKSIQESSCEHLPGNCGTTLASLFVSRQRICAFNAGDSRIYKIEKDRARYISHDHSVVQGLLDNYLILQETAQHHPYKNLIEFGVGPLFVDSWANHSVFVHTERFDPPSAFLLCSDGLSDQLTEEEIHRWLTPEPAKNGHALLSAVMEKGLIDNTSFTVVEID